MIPPMSSRSPPDLPQALCSFWRTLRWCVAGGDAAALARAGAHRARAEATGALGRFLAGRAGRHKSAVPDVGALLALATALGDTYERAAFVDAYLDESSVRSVMWWQRDGVAPRAAPVFAATGVSRAIFLFQLEARSAPDLPPSPPR